MTGTKGWAEPRVAARLTRRGGDDDAPGEGGEIIGEGDEWTASGDVGDEEGEPGDGGTEKKPFDVVFVVCDVSSAKTGAERGPV